MKKLFYALSTLVLGLCVLSSFSISNKDVVAVNAATEELVQCTLEFNKDQLCSKIPLKDSENHTWTNSFTTSTVVHSGIDTRASMTSSVPFVATFEYNFGEYVTFDSYEFKNAGGTNNTLFSSQLKIDNEVIGNSNIIGTDTSIINDAKMNKVGKKITWTVNFTSGKAHMWYLTFSYAEPHTTAFVQSKTSEVHKIEDSTDFNQYVGTYVSRTDSTDASSYFTNDRADVMYTDTNGYIRTTSSSRLDFYADSDYTIASVKLEVLYDTGSTGVEIQINSEKFTYSTFGEDREFTANPFTNTIYIIFDGVVWIKSIEVEIYDYYGSAYKYADLFNDEQICGSDQMSQADAYKWENIRRIYRQATIEVQTQIKNGFALADGNSLGRCLYTYDMAVYKSILRGTTENIDNFMGRETPLLNTSHVISQSGDSNTIAIIVIVSLLSVSTLAAFFLVRKTKIEK